MNFFSLFIFGIVLLLYLHIYYHLKISNDQEIYEVGNVSKDKLEEICDLRQPAIFNYTNYSIIDKSKEIFLDNEGKYKNSKMNIYNTTNDDTNNPVLLTFENSKKLFNDDLDSRYYTKNNEIFLKESALYKIMSTTDNYLKPSLISSSIYDIGLGAEESSTKFKYDINYRNFFCLLSGSVKIKLAAPNNTHHLHEIRDYHNFEFTSPINPWNVQPKYKSDLNMVNTMEVVLRQGQMLFIPAYWWYSIQYKKDTILGIFQYRTFMNDLAILPRLIKKILQSHNVKHKTVPLTKQIIKEAKKVEPEAKKVEKVKKVKKVKKKINKS